MPGRPILRVMAVAASLALLVAALAAPAMAKQDKVFICHKPDTAATTVKIPARVLSKHLAHGDHLGRCDQEVLAIAYSDLDVRIGYDPGDVLIAMLLDTDGNGADPGDRIVMGRYPTDFDATTFGRWRVKRHTVESVVLYLRSPATGILDVQTTSGGRHSWTWSSMPSGLSEAYSEWYPSTGVASTIVNRSFNSDDSEIILRRGSPSAPDMALNIAASQPDRGGFLVVRVY